MAAEVFLHTLSRWWCTLRLVLTLEQKRFLLDLARQTASAATRDDSPPEPALRISDVEYGGVFVTYLRNHKLRGCIGAFTPHEDLALTVQETALAAFHDPRFASRPIQISDVPHLEVEISIVSQPQEIREPLFLELGSHGIIIKHPRGQGCFLPQVAVEFSWDQREFLEHCCRDKAHLEPEAWQDPEAVVYTFTAEVFSDASMTPSGSWRG